MITVKCAHCGRKFIKRRCDVERSPNNRFFCSRKHTALYKKQPKSHHVERVRQYGIVYREDNSEWIKEKKAKHFKETYDPGAASINRKTPEYRKMHNEYLRQPKWVKYKKDYDRIYRAKRIAGIFWESYIICIDIHEEFRKQVPDSYERSKQKGLLERIRFRKELLKTA